jgi:hypothetical protein
MRRDRLHVRATSLFALALVVTALALAGCGHTTPVAARPPLVTGTPTRSISVPISNVGCTLNDVCVAVGTSSSADPNAVAEFATPKGNWIPLDAPAATSPLVDAVACSGAQCLLGGSEPGHDLLWLFQAAGHSLTSITAPAGGIGIDALTCDLDDCALIDTGDLGGPPRFMESSDAGATWGTPQDIDFAVGDAVTAFSCGTASDCAVGVLSATHDFSLYVTNDAGATWNIETTPSTWTTLTSLTCLKRHCVALAQVTGASALVRSTTFTRTWTSLDLTEQATGLSCTPTATCLLAGETSTDKPWLALEHDRALTTLRLRYVPTPLVGAACGSQVCAAIGVTTLLSLPSRS